MTVGDATPGGDHLGAGSNGVVDGAHEHLVDSGESREPLGLGIHPFVQLGGQWPGDAGEVDAVMGELAGGDAEESARCQAVEVDRDDERQRAGGQPQMRPRGDACDVVADIVSHERPQPRVGWVRQPIRAADAMCLLATAIPTVQAGELSGPCPFS